LFGTTLTFSEEKKILPIKKPILSDSELQKKVLVNIIKPLPNLIYQKSKKRQKLLMKKIIKGPNTYYQKRNL
jgi:hypothetical protein